MNQQMIKDLERVRALARMLYQEATTLLENGMALADVSTSAARHGFTEEEKMRVLAKREERLLKVRERKSAGCHQRSLINQ